MGVRHHVHVELPRHHPRRRVVGDVHRLDHARGDEDGGDEDGESDGAHGGGPGALELERV